MSNCEINLRVTGQSSQGGRRYMEDAFIVAYQQTEDKKDLEYAFFGIFDGHGGKEAAQYAKCNLLDNIVSLKHFWQDDDDLVLSAIRDGFLNTHMAMWKEVDNWPRTASGLPSTAGTTASVAFIRKGKLYTGHVGDSRIIIGLKEQGSDAWLAESLTIDHKPETPEEKQRIIDSGGLVMNKSGVERVVWKRPKPGHEGPILRSTDCEKIPFLAVARSLGDLWSFDFFNQEFAVSPEPDLGVMSLDLDKDKCLVLASDGVWNIISPQSAINLVQDVETENKKLIMKFGISENIHLTLCNPSKVLVDCSLERWNQLRTRADNVSVITVMLDQTKSSDSDVLQEQLVLKMNYPRSLTVWDVGNRSKSCPEFDMEGRDLLPLTLSSSLRSTEENIVANQIGHLKLVGNCTFLPGNKLSRSAPGTSSFFKKTETTQQDEEKDSDKKFATGIGNSSSTENLNCDSDVENINLPCSSRLTNSPLQSCSNLLPEYVVAKASHSKSNADGIENSPCIFPRWSKSASGRTSLSTLATWSKVVSHRRMSDPFPYQSQECDTSEYSLSDSEIEDQTGEEHICSVQLWEEMESEQSILGEKAICNASKSTTCSFGTHNFKVSDDQLFNLKQAIKRKYPGTEISHTLISTHQNDEATSQKRKLDFNAEASFSILETDALD